MTVYDDFDDDFAPAKFKGGGGGGQGGRKGKQKNKGKTAPNGCFSAKHVRISLAKQERASEDRKQSQQKEGLA